MGGGMDGTEHWMTFEEYDQLHYCQDCRTYIGPGSNGRCSCDEAGTEVATMSERLTPERLAELRRIAEAATPGPWDRSEGDTDIYIVGGCDRDVAHIDLLGLANARAQDRDNARHIAAFDPPTVLALLDEIERLQHEVMHLRQQYETLRAAIDEECMRAYQRWNITAEMYDQGFAHALDRAERMVRRILSDACPYCSAPMEDDPGRYPSGDVATIWTCGTWVDGDGQRHQHEHCTSQEVPDDV